MSQTKVALGPQAQAVVGAALIRPLSGLWPLPTSPVGLPPSAPTSEASRSFPAVQPLAWARWTAADVGRGDVTSEGCPADLERHLVRVPSGRHPSFSPHKDDHGYDDVYETGYREAGHATQRMQTVA